ncbi:MAG: MarR family transcriptional regulator [Chloroflexota bacterium]
MTAATNASSGSRSDLERLVLDRMGRLVRVFHRNFRQPHELDLFELTMPQCRTVLFLSESPASMGKLAAGLGMALPSATGVIDRMVEKGLVARFEDPEDRRVVLCGLTPQGKAMADGLYEADVAVLQNLLRTLTDSQIGTVLAAIELLLGVPMDADPAGRSAGSPPAPQQPR